jgi:hypothetical protein
VKFTGSLKFAVFTISGLSILIAAGTFVEAEYNAEIAAKLVYKTPWMFAALGLLALNLTSVMVDRWPWQRKHVSFILAHIGILVLLWGSVLTMKYGLDGTLAIEIGGSSRFVRVPETEFTVWSSFDGDRYSKVFEKEVDFYTDRPKTEAPLKVPALGGDIEVVEYQPFAIPNRVIEPSSEELAGSALRFQIQNSQVNVNEWIVQKKAGETARHNFGPAQFHLGVAPTSSRGNNELFIEPTKKGLQYTILYKDPKRSPLKGFINEGQSVNTGWMNLEFRVLRFLPRATERWDFKIMDRPTPISTAALKVKFQGQERWVGLNDVVKFFTDHVVYIVSYSNRRIDVGFDMRLVNFEMGLYPGTNRAASYQSVVQVHDLPGDHLISMNEPLKHKGLTFYQASFQNGPDGKPTTSVFSVNYDPGRALKYIGSLILSLGIIWLFYDRRKAASAAARKMNAKT